ncbi:MAG TPA: hypothetical protein VH373_03335 [Jatrophihabitantaceae bacterium]
MSDLLATPPDDDEDDTSRTRAVWGLAALGILAVLVVVILFATGGSGGGGSHNQAVDTLPSGPPVPTSTQAALSTPPSSFSPSAIASSSASTSAPTSAIPTSTANPCPTAKQCAVPGDAGQLVAAVNRFRTSHGAAAVSGAVSAQAQQCALAQGEGPSCAPSFAWEPVPTQDGVKAVSLVAANWLLDPAMKSFSVGWAYAGGGYECAILKIR